MRPTDPRTGDVKKIAPAVAEITRNRVGTVTLTPNATSTVVVVPTIVTRNSHISFAPMTANAAAAVPPFVAEADRSSSGFTITHASSANVDQTFTWFIWEPSVP